MITDSDVTNVLSEDGIENVDLTTFVNKPVVSLGDVWTKTDAISWAARIVHNESFGGVLICQQEGGSNRMHYHPDAAECWVILSGMLLWDVEGQESRLVKRGDFVNVPAGTRHKISCVGKIPCIRFAITKPDVKHIYSYGENDVG